MKCVDEITNQTYLTTERVELTFDMPWQKLYLIFYDRLKTVSKGYASFDYAPIGMRTSNLVKVDILLNATIVDALSLLIQSNATVCEKLKN
jgi:GTP-binding protein LepA